MGHLQGPMPPYQFFVLDEGIKIFSDVTAKMRQSQKKLAKIYEQVPHSLDCGGSYAPRSHSVEHVRGQSSVSYSKDNKER